MIAEPLSGPALTEVSARRPRVALVAHGIHDGGGMERAFAELIRRAHTQFAFTVFSSELAPDLQALVDWRPTRVPARPIPVRILTFFVRVSLPLSRAQVELVHVLGAIAPNRADVVTVQYCHAGSLAKTGRLAPGGGPLLRRLNRSVARAMAIAAERFCYRPGRTSLFASVSDGVRRELEQHYPGVPIAITPNGVDLERFRPDATVRSDLRGAEQVGDDPVCLFVGGDWDRKGLGVAIEAVSLVEATGRQSVSGSSVAASQVASNNWQSVWAWATTFASSARGRMRNASTRLRTSSSCRPNTKLPPLWRTKRRPVACLSWQLG